MQPRFLIVDDHPLFLNAIQLAVLAAYPQAKIFEASTIDAARKEISANDPLDLILLDLSLPGTTGFDGLLELRTLYPKLPIVIISALEDPRIIHEAMSYGAAGFISKAVRRTDLEKALQDVMAGSVTLPSDYQPPQDNNSDAANSDLAVRLTSLTPQQLRVLKMLRQGMLNKQIAYELRVGETTVKAHVSEILRKLNVSSRTQAVIEVAKIDFGQVVEASNH
ncbi:MAG: response regulator transcription factor [Pseudomonadota bacterium]